MYPCKLQFSKFGHTYTFYIKPSHYIYIKIENTPITPKSSLVPIRNPLHIPNFRQPLICFLSP